MLANWSIPQYREARLHLASIQDDRYRQGESTCTGHSARRMVISRSSRRRACGLSASPWTSHQKNAESAPRVQVSGQ